MSLHSPVPMTLAPLSVTRIAADIEAGRTTPDAVIREANARIDSLDGVIGAFVRRASEDSIAAAAAATGPLRGVPFGVKDIFDTFDMATEHGSPIYAGHQPLADATLVAAARLRGAAILGKTATTEFASMDPATTRNPHDLAHTPGGSSSGSAAGIAAGMLAAACGSQTGGSVIRPAAFCGIAGYKPSFRLLPTVGMKVFSWTLDTAGLFAAGVADVALLAECLSGRELTAPPLADASGLTIGLYRTAFDTGPEERLDPAMAAAWETAAKALEAAGAKLVDLPEPAALEAARAAHGDIQNFEAAQALLHERTMHRGRMGPKVLAQLDEGAAVTAEAYDAGRRTARIGRKAAAALFDTCDALLAPSAFGPAPKGLATTGDPALNKLWTLTGNPCVNVPGLATPEGLPLGLTIVTRFGRDRTTLSIAKLLEDQIQAG